MNVSVLTDDELLGRYKSQHDMACIGELYKRYAALVYGVCFKYLKHEQEAEDLVIDIFESMVDKLKKSDVVFLRSWLFIVTKNTVFQRLREIGRRFEDSFDENEENNPGVFMENIPDITLISEADEFPDDDILLREALSQLKDAQKVCLDLFYLQKKSYQEVAELSGFDIKQVKSFVQNGKRNLKIYLESKGYKYEK